MPLLEIANVELGRSCCGVCHLLYKADIFGGDCPSCVSCLAYEDGSSDTMLPGAIYNAKHLELIFPLGMVIFASDLKSCPTFKNLKTLLLSDYWCAGPDYAALTCILKHSPVLEKLTLQLVSQGQEHQVDIKREL
ncbi:uncharacterized protein LOC124682569 [Lolium rigidum]|uniref:uncharacterized protein LOC124682569 n=1 Tax=Lolium rigidum TaxID=89674 RepID=UPI001F5C32BB|nr:uncharacterized protein LOC124682569 [Lolium rigidum]